MKKLIITEEQERNLIKLINNDEVNVQQMPVPDKTNKPYCVNPDKVLIVKKYLDNNFNQLNNTYIGNDGNIKYDKCFNYHDKFGNSLAVMTKEMVQDHLIDKFKKMFVDTIERDLFIAQVLKDWVNGRIGIFGTLSVNRF